MKFIVLDSERDREFYDGNPPAINVNHIVALTRAGDRTYIITSDGAEWVTDVERIKILSKITQDTYDGVINVSSL